MSAIMIMSALVSRWFKLNFSERVMQANKKMWNFCPTLELYPIQVPLLNINSRNPSSLNLSISSSYLAYTSAEGL